MLSSNTPLRNFKLSGTKQNQLTKHRKNITQPNQTLYRNRQVQSSTRSFSKTKNFPSLKAQRNKQTITISSVPQKLNITKNKDYRNQCSAKKRKVIENQRRSKTQLNEEFLKSFCYPGDHNRIQRQYQRYKIQGVAGKGTFGTVYYGQDNKTLSKIAIKKVLQDIKFKNRQLQILKSVNNPNILQMIDYFHTHNQQQEYLNVVTPFYQYNLYEVIKRKQIFKHNGKLIRLIFYQIVKGLNYLGGLGIAHRDIKPHNILIDLDKHRAVICDFGSAKNLVKGQNNLAYICSRCYRAPELIFGATDYSTQIDMWSAGCVLVQMINGDAPFIADSQLEQLIEIIKVLGTPSKEQVFEMNKNYDIKEYSKFPRVQSAGWESLLCTNDPLLISLVTQIMQYSPKKRLTPSQAILHPYFNSLRDQNEYQQLLIELKTIPDLFTFSKQELRMFGKAHSTTRIVPEWLNHRHRKSQAQINPQFKKSHFKINRVVGKPLH